MSLNYQASFHPPPPLPVAAEMVSVLNEARGASKSLDQKQKILNILNVNFTGSPNLTGVLTQLTP